MEEEEEEVGENRLVLVENDVVKEDNDNADDGDKILLFVEESERGRRGGAVVAPLLPPGAMADEDGISWERLDNETDAPLNSSGSNSSRSGKTRFLLEETEDEPTDSEEPTDCTL